MTLFIFDEVEHVIVKINSMTLRMKYFLQFHNDCMK